jgi:hypothetical protein
MALQNQLSYSDRKFIITPRQLEKPVALAFKHEGTSIGHGPVEEDAALHEDFNQRSAILNY